MSSSKMTKSEINKRYYDSHKEEITVKRAAQYGLKKFNELITTMDLNAQHQSIIKAVQEFDESDTSPENLEWKRTIFMYGQLIAILVYGGIPPEAQEQVKHTFNWLTSFDFRNY